MSGVSSEERLDMPSYKNEYNEIEEIFNSSDEDEIIELEKDAINFFKEKYPQNVKTNK